MIAGISFVVTPIFDILAAVFSCITPYPVRRVWEVVTWGILEIYRRIGAVIINSLFYLGMGAGRSLIPPGVITEKRGDSDNNDVALPTSARVMNWWDIINPDAIVVYHAFKLRQWQYKQGSSVFYTKPTSGFCCIDPAKGHC